MPERKVGRRYGAVIVGRSFAGSATARIPRPFVVDMRKLKEHERETPWLAST